MHTEEDVEKVIDAVRQSVLTMKSGGYFEVK
jgi:hypothetical protein